MENKKPESKCTIVPTSRSIIENVVLARLGEYGTVAILANEEDLSLMISCLRLAKFNHKANEMAADFEKLQRAAFP